MHHQDVLARHLLEQQIRRLGVAPLISSVGRGAHHRNERRTGRWVPDRETGRHRFGLHITVEYEGPILPCSLKGNMVKCHLILANNRPFEASAEAWYVNLLCAPPGETEEQTGYNLTLDPGRVYAEKLRYKRGGLLDALQHLMLRRHFKRIDVPPQLQQGKSRIAYSLDRQTAERILQITVSSFLALKAG